MNDSSPVIHLVCNAHIDPVWLWSWEEGLAETLSTFRIAAGFCEKYDGFVFCHNESLLYQWVEAFEPALFRKIQRLVSAGQWHIIGGWYLQPDANIPCGESFVRQILTGKNYFKSKFGVEPQTAVNFDPFGHSRGLVQILAKSGYTSYLFCRPGAAHLSVPDDFIWSGFDGSEILAHRSTEHYNSEKGKASLKFDAWLKLHDPASDGLFLWGIGNHGGGPSREDLNQLGQRIAGAATGSISGAMEVKHSWPEAYFNRLESGRDKLIRVSQSLNPWAVGCYTSMQRVKKVHRELEEAFFLTEKMVTHATLSASGKYPKAALQEALEDLLFCEFHDILPGSGIPEVEAYALQRMSHGMEILSRLRTAAFFKLANGQPAARPEEFPILIYNPEPFDIEETITVELQGPEPNFNPDLFLLPELFDSQGQPVVYQLEKESANIRNDHRKRLIFNAKLQASSMNRFSCFLKPVSALEKPMNPVQEELHFVNECCEITISTETGLIDQYKVDGVNYLKSDSAELLVMADSADPWGMKVTAFRDLAGRFKLMSPSETAGFTGTNGAVEPVRIIEEGPVRSVVEGLFRFNHSAAAIRYMIPRQGATLEIEVRVIWNEKDKMLKIAFPTFLTNATCQGQVPYGTEIFDQQGDELVAGQWIGLFSRDQDRALTIANRTTYGFDHSEGELRLSLLRSPAYAGHPVDDLTPIVRQDRFTPRMDQGEHIFRFRLAAGNASARLQAADTESRLLNGGSVVLCCHPSGKGRKPASAVRISNSAIRLAALKLAETDDSLVIRLFETTGAHATAILEIPALNLSTPLEFSPFEIKTMLVNRVTKEIRETGLLEHS